MRMCTAHMGGVAKAVCKCRSLDTCTVQLAADRTSVRTGQTVSPLKMRKAKQHSSDIAGDWSTTGTFLRKPAGGWLHEDRELQNGLCVNYSVQYMGSLTVNNSMRTLQFNTRTQVTKEAIQRLAENSGNVFIGKKKKVPKQVEKILGGMDVRWAGEANLSVSVDSLKISNEPGGVVILNHALPSISFASGGDGATADYIGYVAKDPVHGRACHVFECPRSSQFLLATIGQAFELRYKMYLNSSRSSVQPVDVSAGWDSDAWGRARERPDRQGEGRVIHTTADIHPVSNFRNRRNQPESIEETEESGGIYSDIPDLPADLPSDLPPPDSTPPPIPSARYTLAERPPPRSNGHLPETRPHNPYDTMEVPETSRGNHSSQAGGSNLYEDAEFVRGNVTASASGSSNDVASNAATNGKHVHQAGDEYSDTFISIRQSRINDSMDEIDLTPPPRSHDYFNVNPPKKESPLSKRKVPPKPIPFQHVTSPGQRASLISNSADSQGSNSPDEARHNHVANHSPKLPSRSYDPPIALKAKPPVKKKPSIPILTKPGLYDDPDEIITARKKMKPVKPSRENISVSDSDDVYDDTVEESEIVYDLPEEGVYNTAEGVYDDHGTLVVPVSPKFDDGIYMDSKGVMKQSPGPFHNMAPVAKALPNPYAPLPQQRYFHGTLSRVEAEALLMTDGEYLIRESSKKPGQYVLTGMAAGKTQHLLLMDREGRVKSKDREFESVPHLIQHFTESKLPLVIGNSQVFLKRAVVNINN